MLKINSAKVVHDKSKNDLKKSANSTPQNENGAKSDKSGLILMSLGAISVLGLATIGILKHKKIKLEKLAKLEDEARNLKNKMKAEADKLAQEAKKAAEEAAQKAADEAKKVADEAAQKAAESAAKKAAQEAAVLAKVNLHKESLLKLDQYADDAVNIPHTMTQESQISNVFESKYKEMKNKTAESVGDEILDMLKSIESKGDELSHAEFQEFFKKASNSTKKDFSKYKCENAYYDSARLDLKAQMKKKEIFLDDVGAVIKESPKKADETISQYFERILTKQKELKIKKETDVLGKIKSQLKYTDDALIAKVILTNDEKQELATTLKNLGCDVNMESSIEDLAFQWRQKYISGGFFDSFSNPRIEKACLQELERYSSKSYGRAEGKYVQEPVYRWLKGGLDDVIKNIPEEGAVYQYPKLQSCSKNSKYGEAYGGFDTQYNFTDWQDTYSMKFVIHPKSSVSKAYSVGEGKYGDCEVLYPSNAKFKVLSKRLVEVNKADYPEFTEKKGSFLRWVVDLQEI